MPVTLTDAILSGKRDPSPETIKSWVISGGSDSVEKWHKDHGWNGEEPIISLGLHLGNDGAISEVEMFAMGFLSIGRVYANSIFGTEFHEKTYLKVETMDLSTARFRGKMVSDWMAGAKLDWTLKVYNEKAKKYSVIGKLEKEKLEEVKACQPSFRCHLALNRGLKVDITLGIVPDGDIELKTGSTSMNYPMMQIGRTRMNALPAEPRKAGYGLGVLPFIIYNGEGEAPIPQMGDIRLAVAKIFNTSCKIKLHTKLVIWRESAALGQWDLVDPSFIYPDPSVQPDDLQGEKSIEQTILGIGNGSFYTRNMNHTIKIKH